MKYRPRSSSGMSSRNGGIRRVGHPSGGSTLITSAPMSAKILPHNAPLSSARSSILNPLSSSELIDTPVVGKLVNLGEKARFRPARGPGAIVALTGSGFESVQKRGNNV